MATLILSQFARAYFEDTLEALEARGSRGLERKEQNGAHGAGWSRLEQISSCTSNEQYAAGDCETFQGRLRAS